MKFSKDRVEDINIAYIGGGSRGWAWTLMSDLACEKQISGTVRLYDLNYEAAKNNEVIGNTIAKEYPEHGNFKYQATETIDEALNGADFVLISILPGTYDDMAIDVHLPEKYGIYQAVGDSVGPGGLFRAFRAVTMFREIALSVREHCPNAWVINFTNPMTMCTKTLYKAFPQIKAFGCCHEVFGTQALLAEVMKEALGVDKIVRDDIIINVTGVNHFTWLTKASYKDHDIIPYYRKYCEENRDNGSPSIDENWFASSTFTSRNKIKMDLFLKFGYIAAAGDRHLVEFCPGNWYLKDPDTVTKWGYKLTPVSFRKNEEIKREEKSQKYLERALKFEIKPSGEETTRQIKALLGLGGFLTNVNIPNRGQIPNLPDGAILETNAYFSSGTLIPVHAGEIPEAIYGLVSTIINNQECIVNAAYNNKIDEAFPAFINDPQNNLSLDDSVNLFNDMKKAHCII